MKVTTDACLFGAWCSREIQKEKGKIETVLDAGTGTGLLSLMLAQNTGALITAVEIDKDAAAEAAENFAASPWSYRLKLIQGDLTKLSFNQPFDCIVCNPPFYETDLKGPDAKRNLAHHATDLPTGALFQFLSQCIAAQGIIYLLLPYKRKEELEEMMQRHELHLQKEVLVHPTEKNTASRWMVALCTQPSHAISKETIFIRQSGIYSARFIELLKDYYLYL